MSNLEGFPPEYHTFRLLIGASYGPDKEVKHMSVSTDVQRQAMLDAGVSPAQVDKAMAGLANLREKAAVTVVTPDEPKYGDATIVKRNPNGSIKQRAGYWADDFPTIITGLQAILAQKRPEVEFTPFALTTEDDDPQEG